MSEKKDRKSKRDGALSNVCILIDDTSVAETKPLKVSIAYACMFILGRSPSARQNHCNLSKSFAITFQ